MIYVVALNTAQQEAFQTLYYAIRGPQGLSLLTSTDRSFLSSLSGFRDVPDSVFWLGRLPDPVTGDGGGLFSPYLMTIWGLERWCASNIGRDGTFPQM